MSATKAEVESEWVKSKLFPELLKNEYFRKDNSLGDDSTEGNVKIRDVQVKFVCSEEAFMMATCFRAIITLEEGNSGPKTTTLIVKKTPNVPQETYDILRFPQLFSNEILTYNTIFPAIEKLGQQTFNFPRFYFAEEHKNSATVALQDFAADNWRLCEQKFNLSLQHALVAVSNLGTFHGVTFGLRHKNRNEFDRLVQDVKESRYDTDDMPADWRIIITVSAERAAIAARKYQKHIDEKFLDRYQRLIEDSNPFGRKMVAPIEPLVTLCHGDFLRNNIAFKYTDVNGTEEPIDSLMFDLQMTRVSSPMVDFCTYLCLSANAAVRQQNFDRIFNAYYDKLIAAFKKSTQEVEVPDYLSRESMLREYARMLPYSVSLASFFLMRLVEPVHITSEEFILQDLSPEVLTEDSLNRGGDEVDQEIAAQIKEMYELVQKYNLDIFKGFDYL